MIIAVNTRWLIPGKLEGFGWYTYHLLGKLASLMPDAEFVFITDQKHKEQLVEKLNVRYVAVNPPARHPFLWHIWNQYSIPLVLKQVHADLYFSPDGFLPYKLHIPALTTIHDLNFEEKNSSINKGATRFYKKHIRKSAQVADHILTVSEFSRKDIIAKYKVPKNKITAVHNGPQKLFTDHSNRRTTTQQRYAGGHPYFLFVGAQNPRKNLHRIFEAFDGFLLKNKSNHALVLVGERMYWDGEIRSAWKKMKNQERVFFTGRISSEELNNIYSAAEALVYPSLFEGFGMPIIEAFASGCPVITSLSTSLPEVAGDAAIFVDPTQVDEILDAMTTVILLDDAAGEIMRQKSFERAKLFSWDNAAKVTRDVIKSLLRA